MASQTCTKTIYGTQKQPKTHSIHSFFLNLLSSKLLSALQTETRTLYVRRLFPLKIMFAGFMVGCGKEICPFPVKRFTVQFSPHALPKASHTHPSHPPPLLTFPQSTAPHLPLCPHNNHLWPACFDWDRSWLGEWLGWKQGLGVGCRGVRGWLGMNWQVITGFKGD